MDETPREETPREIAKREWLEKHQPFELDYHQKDNYRWHDEGFGLAWISNFRDFGELDPNYFTPEEILVDAGCGSRSAFEYFTTGRKVYVDPLLDKYLQIPEVQTYWADVPHEALNGAALEQSIFALRDRCALVNCWNVLDHVFDWRKALANMLWYLRPGGIFLLCTDLASHGEGHPGIDDPAEMLTRIIDQCRLVKCTVNFGDTVKRDITLKGIKI